MATLTTSSTSKGTSLTPYTEPYGYVLIDSLSFNQRDSTSKVSAYLAFAPSNKDDPQCGRFLLTNNLSDCKTCLGYALGNIVKEKKQGELVASHYDLSSIKNETFNPLTEKSRVPDVGTLLVEAIFAQSIQGGAAGHIRLLAVGSFDFYKKHHFEDDTPQAADSRIPRYMHLSDKGIRYFKERLLTSPVPHVSYLAEQLAPLAAENPKDTDPRDTAEEISRIILDYLSNVSLELFNKLKGKTKWQHQEV